MALSPARPPQAPPAVGCRWCATGTAHPLGTACSEVNVVSQGGGTLGGAASVVDGHVAPVPVPRGTAAADGARLGMNSDLGAGAAAEGVSSPLARRDSPVLGELVTPGALAPPVDRAMDVIRRADARVERKATRIVDWAADAAWLRDDGSHVDAAEGSGQPAGWTAVRHNVARDARKPLKQQPGYLAMASRIKESYVKAKSGQGPPPQLNAEVVVVVNGDVNVYPRKDVTDRER